MNVKLGLDQGLKDLECTICNTVDHRLQVLEHFLTIITIFSSITFFREKQQQKPSHSSVQQHTANTQPNKQYLIWVRQFLKVCNHLFQKVILNEDLQPRAMCSKGMLFISNGPHYTGRHKGHRNVVHHTLEGEMPTMF